MNFRQHEHTGRFNETRHRVERSTSRRALGKPRNSAQHISIRPKSLHPRPLRKITISVNHVAPVMRKTEAPVEFRNKNMKPRLTINEMSRKKPDVVLWRRFGCG